MFDRIAGVRFSHSPSGGGEKKEHETTLPAWDFQWILPTFEVLKEYSFGVRVVYRERCNRAEVAKEYKKWREKLMRDGEKKDK
jgi:hypothetical protein